MTGRSPSGKIVRRVDGAGTKVVKEDKMGELVLKFNKGELKVRQTTIDSLVELHGFTEEGALAEMESLAREQGCEGDYVLLRDGEED